MSKENFIKKIIFEDKPNKFVLISNGSISLVESICKFINKTKLTNFQYFHTKVTFFILDNFDKKEIIEKYKEIRGEWDKVLDVFILDLNSPMSFDTIKEFTEDYLNFIINDFNEFDKNLINQLEYKNYLDITKVENFEFDDSKYQENIIELPKEIILETKEVKKNYNTDKFSHGYAHFYENYFKELKNAKNVLEIGISDGSIEYLKDKFPNAKIHGIDLTNKSDLNSDRVQTYICNQENREDLQNFIESCETKFDVIIDDGGHTMKQQQTSLGLLYKQLNDGGIYIIENIHTSRLENLGTITKEDIITTLDMLFNFKFTKKIVSNHITEEEKEYINKNINSIDIWTETPQYNLGVTSVIKKSGISDVIVQDEGLNGNNKGFDIGITTFSLRFDFVKNLIKKIRSLGIQNKIILSINGEKNGEFDLEYRKKILNLCLEEDNIYPVFFLETRGLSKLWNTLLIHCVSEDMLIMNDDVELNNDSIFKTVSAHINSQEYGGLSKINNSFSHFICNKKFINSLGYFDERLLGFGEEDGDITFRMIEKYNREVNNIGADGIINVVSDIRHEYIKRGIGKYSLYNREFMFKEKYKFVDSETCIRGMFDSPCERILDDLNQYPSEIYFIDNKDKL